MSTADDATRTGGRGLRLSPRTGALLAAVILAALVGALVGRFLTYSDAPLVALPTVAVPDDAPVRSLQAAAEADPTSEQAWVALGTAATRHAIATADPAWYGVATDAFATARTLDPEDPFLALAEGQLALSLHDFTRARELGQEATAGLPSTADAYGVLVDAHVELGDYRAAETALQTMLDLDPDLAALSRASYLRQLNGDLDGAIIALRQADSAASSAGQVDAGIVATLLGDALLQAGALESAQAAYARASTTGAAVGLARIALALDQPARAQQILAQVVDRTPAPAAVVALAEVQQRRGDEQGLAQTVELARTLATLQQAAGQSVDLELALFEASFGDPTTAAELAEEAYAARPDNIYAAGALAWALHRAGDTSRAGDLAADAMRLGTVDTAHELRMATVLDDADLRSAVLARNAHAERMFTP